MRRPGARFFGSGEPVHSIGSRRSKVVQFAAGGRIPRRDPVRFSCDGAEASSRPVAALRDGRTPHGLFLVLLGSGNRHTIGRFGEVTLAEARTAARRLRAERTLGTILPSSVTLQKAREEYLTKIRVRLNTKLYYTRNLKRLTGPKLRDITDTQIHRILDAMGESSQLQALRS